jgi:ABC-type glycerol-3-phosphate transport system substrate-binding protein
MKMNGPALKQTGSRSPRAWLLLLAAGLLILALAACSSPASDPAGVVVEYYRALVDGNLDRMKSLSCAAWEENAQLEFDAFAGVETALGDLTCQAAGTDGEYTLVECSGAIEATYGNEVQDFDLGGVSYRVLQEAGEWRMCGY